MMNSRHRELYSPRRFVAAGALSSTVLAKLLDTEAADRATIAAGAPTDATAPDFGTKLAAYALASSNQGTRNDPNSGYAAYKAAHSGGTSGTGGTGGTRTPGGSGNGTITTANGGVQTLNTGGSFFDKPVVKYGAVAVAIGAGVGVIALAVHKSRKGKRKH